MDFAGSLELVADCIVLSGTAAQARESHRRLRIAELADAHLGRLTRRRGGHDKGLLLVGSDGGRVEIASLDGVGALHELAEALEAQRGKPASEIRRAADGDAAPSIQAQRA